MPPCGRDILQSPAEPCPASVGDDLRAKSRHFVPAALRNAACRRQCSHRPAEPCGGLPSPLHRPCVPHCRAGVHARRGSLRRVEHFGFAQTLPRKALRCRKPQAAGEIARPTKSPQAGGGTQTSADRQARRRADASIGPYAGAACRPPSTARVPRIVGRAFTPAGEVCGGWNISVLHRRCPAKPCDTTSLQAAGVNARPTKSPQVGGGTQTSADRQARRRPGRVLARPGAAPLRRLRHLPLQGRLYERLPLKKAPLQGELDAP